jgi:4-amino-4-deoxy-L-arabinose transferase-like glycosyltransferase
MKLSNAEIEEKLWVSLRDPKTLALILFITVMAIKLSIINYPSPEKPPSECVSNFDGCGFVFDEAHYIPAVRKLMMGEPANNEHPPLSKALMMLGITIFGDNPLGWRFFSVLSGSISVVLLLLLSYRFLRKIELALASALIYLGDVMTFNIGQIAMLDAPALMFLLMGTLLVLSGRRALGYVVLGLSMLCKTSSIFGIASVILIDAFLQAMRREGLSRMVEKSLDSAALSALIVMAVFLSGLAVYDYAYNAFPSPLAHLDFILNYHSSLSYKCTENVMLLYCIHKDSPYSKEGVVIDLPLRWTIPINTFAPAPYYVTEVSVDGYSYKPIAYYGIYSPIWWLTWAVLIFTAPTALRSLLQLFSRKYGSISEEGILDLFVFIWICLNYFVYFPIAYVLHRWVYTFYFTQTVPAIALSLPRSLWEDRAGKSILVMVVSIQLWWLFMWFPVKSELHVSILKSLGLPA